MQRALIGILLVVCLAGLLVTSGCLFGKKGEEGASSKGAAKAPGAAPAAGPGGPPGGPAAKGALVGQKGPGAGPAGPPGGAGPALGPGAAPKGALKAGGVPPGGKAAPAGPAAGGGVSPAKVNQAKVAKAAGDYAKALQLLAGASQQDAEAQWLKAWILAEQGKKTEAIAAFQAFLAAAKPTDPRVSQAKAALDRLGGGVGAGAGMAKAGRVAGPGKMMGPK